MSDGLSPIDHNEVCINGLSNGSNGPWIYVPDFAPPPRGYSCHLWSRSDHIALKALLPRYGWERTSWALDRSVEALKARAFKYRIMPPCAADRPTADTVGGVYIP